MLGTTSEKARKLLHYKTAKTHPIIQPTSTIRCLLSGFKSFPTNRGRTCCITYLFIVPLSLCGSDYITTGRNYCRTNFFYRMKQIISSLSCALFVVLTACTEPIIVGADLLNDDRATLGQTVDIPFTTRVVEGDSLLTYFEAANSPVRGFSFGELEDDVFGTTKHSAYVVPGLVRGGAQSLPVPPPFAFTDRNVDSVVLILPVDTSFIFYGNARSFDFRASLIDMRVEDDLDYYSNVEFTTARAINENDVITATATPTLLYDTLYATNNDSILAPHVRVKFDQEFLLNVNAQDSATFESDDALATLLAGVHLEATDNSDGLLGLQPTSDGTPFGGFYFFYKDTSATMTERFYRMPLNLALPRYEKSYAGSLVGNLLEEGNDLEQIALSGQGGLLTEINFPDLTMLEDKVINQAEMTFFRQAIENYSYDTYPAPATIALYYRNDSGNLVRILDLEAFGNSSFGFDDFVGGNELTDEEGNVFYRPRFSVHLQRMIEGDVPSTIFLRVSPIDRDPSRVILAGPEAPVRPASIKVTFTEIGG